MEGEIETGQTPIDSVWFISSAESVDRDLIIGEFSKTDHELVAYKISALAEYMLNPAEVKINYKLVGCCIYFSDQNRSQLLLGLENLLPEKLKRGPTPPQMVISDMDIDAGQIRDVNLQAHFDYIYHQLKGSDPVIRTLNHLDEDTVTDIEGVSRDAVGNISRINLAGPVRDKIAYIEENLFQEVPLTLKKAHLGEGLFELGGFDFPSFNPKTTYTLVRTIERGEGRAIVMTNDHKIHYEVEDVKFVFYLQLLEQLLKVNPELVDAFRVCIAGKATPLKLFFKSRLGIDYSPEKMPYLIQEVLKKHPIKPGQKEIVANALRDRQFGISFMYVPETVNGTPKQETNLSILHNFKELEAIEKEAPQVVSAIGSMVASTDVGKFYLLDKYKGYTQ